MPQQQQQIKKQTKKQYIYIDHFARCTVNNTGQEALPVSVCNCFLYFTCK